MVTQSPGSTRYGGRRFNTTSWSLVLAAGDSQHPSSREALTVLCETYWHPVYAYVIGRGYKREMAEDLTQGFFAQLLAKKYLGLARQERGRFRSFLLASVKNYLANEWDREQAKKRGGDTQRVALDFNRDDILHPEPAHSVTPESVFERRWALTLLEQVFHQLAEEMERSGNRERFLHLKGFLTGEVPGATCKQIAAELKITEEAVRVAVHRIRRRFGQLLRAQIVRTIDDPEEVDEEIRYLFSALDS